MMPDSFSSRIGPSFLAVGAGRRLAPGIASAVLSILILTSPVLADDKATCSDGIGMIKAEIAKAPQEAVLSKLKKALRVAEREMGEGEFDECVDAVADAKRALK